MFFIAELLDIIVVFEVRMSSSAMVEVQGGNCWEPTWPCLSAAAADAPSPARWGGSRASCGPPGRVRRVRRVRKVRMVTWPGGRGWNQQQQTTHIMICYLSTMVTVFINAELELGPSSLPELCCILGLRGWEARRLRLEIKFVSFYYDNKKRTNSEKNDCDLLLPGRGCPANWRETLPPPLPLLDCCPESPGAQLLRSLERLEENLINWESTSLFF